MTVIYLGYVFFELVNVPFKCIFCLKEIEKDFEQFLVQSKETIFDVNLRS